MYTALSAKVIQLTALNLNTDVPELLSTGSDDEPRSVIHAPQGYGQFVRLC